MSLLAAILNQTTKILATVLNVNSNTNAIQSDVQNGLTAQGYTTGRAPQLDTITTINSNTQPSVISSDVQTGLNNNGYTPGRAGELDNLGNLNASVSSREPKRTTYRASAAMSSGGTTTLISIGGTGILHGVFGYLTSTGAGAYSVVIDGVTIVGPISELTNTPIYATPSGQSTQNTDAGLQWHWQSSLVITANYSGPGSNFVQVVYAQ
jgi:hypothetical protein